MQNIDNTLWKVAIMQDTTLHKIRCDAPYKPDVIYRVWANANTLFTRVFSRHMVLNAYMSTRAGWYIEQ